MHLRIFDCGTIAAPRYSPADMVTMPHGSEDGDKRAFGSRGVEPILFRGAPVQSSSMIRPLFTCLILFFVAFFLRLQGITTIDPHTDEQHWLSRSAKFLYKLEHAPYEATSHFGHPGLVPGIVMAGAQVIAQTLNNQFGDGTTVVPLIPSRISMAAIASLAVPLLFLLMHTLFGVVPAVFAALLLMLDPHHVGLSRLAHLDASLTSFILLATLLYVWGVQRDRRGLILLAGIAWGCAIATKPTAAAFVPVLFVYRIARWRLLPHRPAPLWWADVWAIVVGHAVLVSLSTRFWYHKSELLVKLKVKSIVARWFHRSGMWLEEHHVVAMCGVVSLWVVFLLCLYLHRRGSVARWKCHGAAIVALFFSVLSFNPALLENCARYWTWAAGLSGIAHDGFGHRWPSPTYGYFTLLLASLPEVALLGLALGLGALLFALLRKRRSEQACLLLFSVVLVLLWCMPLQTASKQGWRYALPIVPFLYLLCAYGYWSVAQGLRGTGSGSARRAQLAAVAFSMVVVLQGAALLSFEPYPLVYVNKSMGGLKGALNHYISYPPVGLVKAAEILHGEAQRRQKEILVTVVGDEGTMKLASRLLPPPQYPVRYSFYRQESADYLLAPLQLRDTILGDGWNNVLENAPIYSYSFHDLVVYEIYAIPPTTLPEPWVMAMRSMAHLTGTVTERGCLELREGRDTRGIIASHFGIEVAPMQMHVVLKGELVESSEKLELEVALGGDCRRTFRSSDSPNAVGPFAYDFTCDIRNSRRVRPQIVWSGKGTLCLDSISIMKGT